MKIARLLWPGMVCSTLLLGQPYTERWTQAAAEEWYAGQGWLVGANFLPSSAINQLEMWQAETYDSATIDRELSWASSIGMNTMRVYLHDLVWSTDSAGFKDRIDNFLAISHSHDIRIAFVLFDDCWNPSPVAGPQPSPRPGVHNSGWVRSPHVDVHNESTEWDVLKRYVQDVLTTFSDDSRVLMWDLYNEPGNSGYGLTSFPLLKKVFEWSREIRPSQPLTSAVWFQEFPQLNEFQLRESDIVTFHNYSDTSSLRNDIAALRGEGRPIICSEYMARTNQSRFQTHLPIFKAEKIGAINWGLVSGKSNTIFPWGSTENTPEPAVWFHDIFRRDGIPFDQDEVELVRKLTGAK